MRHVHEMAAHRCSRALHDIALAKRHGTLPAAESFELHMGQLREFLLSCPEQSIALVAHLGVFAALAGRSLQNAEFFTITL